MFREAVAEDFHAVMGLYRQLHPGDPVVDDSIGAGVFAEMLASSGLHLYVLEVDGVVVATTYLNVIPNLTRSASPYAVIENVVVEESRRGQGLGKATLAAAWRAGCYKVMLMTGSRRPAVHGFYVASGLSADVKRAYVAHRP